MQELMNLTSEQIKTFLIVAGVLALGIKKIVEYMGWFGDQWKKKQSLSPARAKQERERLHEELLEHENQAEQERMDLGRRITTLEGTVVDLKEDLEGINDSLESMKQSDLKRRLFQIIDKSNYYIRMGYCPKIMKEAMVEEVKDYLHRCGGNHITEDILNDIRVLPDEPPQNN